MKTKHLPSLIFLIVSLTLLASVVYTRDLRMLITLPIVIFFSLLMKNLIYSSSLHPKLYEIFLFLTLFTGPPRLRSRDPMASIRGEIDWVVILHIVIWTAGALWVLKNILVDLRSTNSRRFNGVEKIGLLFACMLGLTIFVSSAPLLTAFRVFQIFVMILFSHYWVSKFGIDMAFKSLFLAYVVMGLGIAAAAIFEPSLVYVPYAQTMRMRGDYIANAGTIGAVGLILLLSYPAFRTRWMLFSVAILFSWLLLASRTRSAYASFLIFLFLNFLKAPKIASLRLVRYGFILTIPIIMFFSDEIFSFLIREKHSLSTLSDRTVVWDHLIRTTLEKSPLLGFGFYSERIIVLEVNPGIGTAHGAFAAVLSGSGILGSIAFSLLLLGLLSRAFKLFAKGTQNPVAFSAVAVLLAVLSTGLVSEEMIIASPTGFTFYMLISLLPVVPTRIRLSELKYLK